jgi:hypothetical protein
VRGDQLDSVATHFDGSWKNGIQPPLVKLPPDAPIEEVLNEGFKGHEYTWGRVGRFTIKRSREFRVERDSTNDKAALVETDLGWFGVVLEYQANYMGTGWWVRPFSARPEP